MTLSPDSFPSSPPVGRGWLIGLRLALLISLILLGLAGPAAAKAASLPIVIVPASLYLIVLLGSVGPPARATLRSARILAAGTVIVLVVAAAARLSRDDDDLLRPQAVYWAVLGLTQLAVLVCAGKCLSLQGRETRGWNPRVLALGVFIAAVVLLLLFASVIPGTIRARMAAREARAVFRVREVNRCADLYRKAHPEQGYAADLRALTTVGRGCEAPTLTAPEWEEYRLEYRPMPSERSGVIWHYEVRARPLRYGSSGYKSIYSDESGVVRATDEDRQATLHDPPLPKLE